MSRSARRSSRFIPACALLAALPAGFFAFRGHAEEAPQAKPETAPKAQENPPLLVTATRLPEAKESVGSPVTQITADDLRRSQAPTLTDALQGTPGLSVMRSGGAGQPASVFMRGANAGHTLFLMDGVRVMDPSASGGDPALDALMADGFDKIEILPGAQSPLYGSSAIGGVIAATTAKGQGPAHGSASVEGGSRNSWTERVQGGGGDDAFNWHVGALRHDTAGFSATQGDTERDAYRNTSFSTRLGWNITDVFGVDFFARGCDARAAFDDAWAPENPYTRQDQGYVKVAPHLTLADGKWEQTLNLSAFGARRKTLDFGEARFTGANWDADWQNTFHLAPTLDLVAGVEVLHERARGESSYSQFEAEATTVSPYAQARYAPAERVTLNAGVRADRHSEFGSHGTWRGAAAYDSVETNATLRASAGTAFKAPTLAQLYDTTSFFGPPTNNPGLRPERSLGFDAGVDQRFLGQGKDAKLTLGATYFENHFRDLITSVFPNPYANAQKARARGVELAAKWTALADATAGTLTLGASYTYTDSRRLDDGSGDPLLRRPWNQAAFRLDYALPRDQASFGVAGRYLGNRRDIDPVTFANVNAPGRFTLDAVARVKITRQLSAFGRLENLFDNGTPEVLGYNPTPFGAFAGVEVAF